MGKVKGFVCLNCEYEESYFVGFGFRVREEKVLYACSNCEALTSTNAKTPRCRKCRSRRLTEVKDIHGTAKCPECNHEGVLEEGGCWDWVYPLSNLETAFENKSPVFLGFGSVELAPKLSCK